MTLRIGTRGSLLARTQSDLVGALLSRTLGERYELVTMSTAGDETTAPLISLGQPGVFVGSLRQALLAGAVDLVVHSFKDLPTAPEPGLVVAAVPLRADPRDVLVSRDWVRLADLPRGARVGTGSPRRAAALGRARPDLRIEPVRGNVDTRLALVRPGGLDAVVLAKAGLDRIGQRVPEQAVLDLAVLLPAPAQGALAVECREGTELADRLPALDHVASRLAVTAERAVLAGVDAACTTAVGALASYADGVLTLTADLADHRGVGYARSSASLPLPVAGDTALAAAHRLGNDVAARLLTGAAS